MKSSAHETCCFFRLPVSSSIIGHSHRPVRRCIHRPVAQNLKSLNMRCPSGSAVEYAHLGTHAENIFRCPIAAAKQVNFQMHEHGGFSTTAWSKRVMARVRRNAVARAIAFPFKTYHLLRSPSYWFPGPRLCPALFMLTNDEHSGARVTRPPTRTRSTSRTQLRNPASVVTSSANCPGTFVRPRTRFLSNGSACIPSDLAAVTMLATPEKTSTTSRSRGVLAMFEAKIEFTVCPNNSKTGGASSKPPLLVPTSGAPGASTKLLMDEKHSHTTQKSERALRAHCSVGQA